MNAMTPLYQGYVDERSIAHVKGWLRDVNDAKARLAYEVVLPGDEGERVLATGRADGFSEILVQVGVGDGGYAFEAHFNPPLIEAERELVYVRPQGAAHRLELAPNLRTDPPGQGPYQGFVDACSTRHVAGWVRDLADGARRVVIDLLLPGADGEVLLQRHVAAQTNDMLRKAGLGDGQNAFFVLFDRELSEVEREVLIVRVHGSAHVVERSPRLNREFHPLQCVRLDIVNNCNLRCPFCVYDYTETFRTNVMEEATFQAALRLIPYVPDGNFWLSCLHEATLHPRLMEFIALVPREYRRKLFFTTNLAKRQTREFFEALAGSGLDHINISLESFDKDIYERMRKGARQGIFLENLALLLEVFGQTPGAPGIRYNLMAYRANLQELPGLARILLEEKQAWQVEIRYTFDGPQIPQDFRQAEFLSTDEWAWLARELSAFPAERVLLFQPPGGRGYDREAPPPPPAPSSQPPERRGWVQVQAPVSRPLNVRILWDGTLSVSSDLLGDEDEHPERAIHLLSNINALEDPLAACLALE